MPDELQVRLQPPAGYDLRSVGQLQVSLVVAYDTRHAGERHGIAVKRTDAVGKTCVDESGAKLVVRPLRDHAAEHDAAVDIGIHQISVGRAQRGPAVHRDAALRIATARAIELLIDDAVDTDIAAMAGGDAGARRIREQQALKIEALVIKLPEVPPAA